jgi:hypothetical protein
MTRHVVAHAGAANLLEPFLAIGTVPGDSYENTGD